MARRKVVVEQVRDLEEVMAQCRLLGWKVRAARAGHFVVYAPGVEEPIVVNPADPQEDQDDAWDQLVDAGFTKAWAAHQEREQAANERRLAAQEERIAAQKKAVPFGDVAVGSSGMYTKSELITPERAQEIIDREEKRAAELQPGVLRQRKVYDFSWLVDIVERGEWKESPQGLIFAPDEELLDGQHRLRTIVTTGQTLPMRVTYNCPRDVFATLDTGRNRKLVDVLTIEGVTGGPILASTLKMLWCYDAMVRGELTPFSWRLWNKVNVSNEALSLYRAQHPGIADLIPTGQTLARALHFVAATCIGFQHIARTAFPDGIPRLREFTQSCKDGVMLERGDPVHTLRNWALDRAPERIVPRREIQLGMLLKAWNAYAQNNPIRLLRFNVGDAMPLAFDPNNKVDG